MRESHQEKEVEMTTHNSQKKKKKTYRLRKEKKGDSYLWLDNFSSYVTAYITHILAETL